MENSGTQIYPSHRFLHFLSLDSLLSLTVIPYIYIFISIYKYQISDHFLWIPTSKIKIPALSTSSIIWLGFGVSDLGFWLTFLGFRVSSWVRNGDFVPLSCHCCSGNFCFFFLSLSLSFSFFFWLKFWGYGVSGWGILRGAVLPGSSATARLCSPVLLWCQHCASRWRQHQRDCFGNAGNSSEFCVYWNGCMYRVLVLMIFPEWKILGLDFAMSVFLMNYMM